jgi:Protein of unknown function (DUF4229)
MALLRYTVLRVLVFLATAGVLWLLGLRGLWLALIAILLSGFISIVVLYRSRAAASIEVSERLSRGRDRDMEAPVSTDGLSDSQDGEQAKKPSEAEKPSE